MEKIIDGQLIAYKNRDAKAMMPYFHEGIEIFTLKRNNLTEAGHTAVQQKYEVFFQRSPDLHFELLDRKVFRNYVTDYEKISGFLGKASPVEAMVVYQIEDDLIRRVWIGL